MWWKRNVVNSQVAIWNENKVEYMTRMGTIYTGGIKVQSQHRCKEWMTFNCICFRGRLRLVGTSWQMETLKYVD